MEIVVRGRHMDVSAQFREHATASLRKLGDHGLTLSRADVEVSKEANPRLAGQAITVELTCVGRGPVVRAEAASADKYVAFDQALQRLEERMRRAADRRRGKRHSGRPVAPPSAVGAVLPAAAAPAQQQPDEADHADHADDVVYAEGPLVVREKTHTTAPMTVEQALDAMERVGHDFYLFIEASSGRPSVVYRRRGFDYGLIRVDLAADAAAG